MSEVTTRKRKLLFLHKYDRRAAAYRYRFEQYFPFFQAAGIEVSSDSLFDNNYLERLFTGSGRSFLKVLAAYFRRVCLLLKPRGFDGLVIYMELLPYAPFFVEKLLIGRKRYVLDFDDAYHLNYQRSKNPLLRWLLGNKVKKLIRGASAVAAGSPELFQYAKSLNPTTKLVPTVVNTDIYKPRQSKHLADKPVIIGWIGSPSTAVELATIAESLQRLSDDHNFDLLVVGSGPVRPKLPNVHFECWSEEKELAQLDRMDIGIMPLEDSNWNRGKCGFKLIQYMAMGKPVVASAVGANHQIVDNGENGFLVQTPDEWRNALSSLIKDANLRRTFGQNARQKIQDKYSLAQTAPQYLEILRSSL